VWLVRAQARGPRSGNGHGSDEPIASARNRFDIARRLGVIVERRAECVDGECQARLADSHGRPNRVEQLVLGHELTGVLDKVAQDIERFRCQRDTIVATPQHRIRGVEAKLPEAVSLHSRDHTAGSRAGATLPKI